MTETTTRTDAVTERLDALLSTGGWGVTKDEHFATMLTEIRDYLDSTRGGDDPDWGTEDAEEVSLPKAHFRTLLIAMTMEPVEIRTGVAWV